MPITSMTGFARIEGYEDICSWIWEAKSVNSKSLDIRCRVPGGFDTLEPQIRSVAQKNFKRGHIYISLVINWNNTDAAFRINQSTLEQIMDILPEIQRRVPEASSPSLDGLLNLRGVIEQLDDPITAQDKERLSVIMIGDLETVFIELEKMRNEEGARLADILKVQLAMISRLCRDASKLDAARPVAIRNRLARQISDLIAEVIVVSEDRLAQEVALLVTKADVREELDRLRCHVEGAEALFKDDGPVGRKLDFLCQEFNREANTLCSKSSDSELTRIGLELKSAIDKIREQVQNIE